MHVYYRVCVIYSRVQSLVERYRRDIYKGGRDSVEQSFLIFDRLDIYIYILQGACYILSGAEFSRDIYKIHRYRRQSFDGVIISCYICDRVDICVFITGCVLYIIWSRVQSRDTQERDTRVGVWWSRESESGIYIYIYIYIFFFIYIYIYIQSLVDYSYLRVTYTT